MNIDNVNRWLTLVANLGVIAGIVFLAVEISQNTTAIRADIYQTRSYASAESNRVRAESEFILPIWVKVRDDTGSFDASLLDSLTYLEKERLWASTEELIRLFDNNMYQCEIGFHEESFCSPFKQQIRNRLPDWQVIAESVGTQVNPAFRLIYEAAEQD